MIAVWILAYVIVAILTYVFFDKKTKQSKFNKVWFSIFWPTVVIFYVIYSAVVGIIKFLKKKK